MVEHLIICCHQVVVWYIIRLASQKAHRWQYPLKFSDGTISTPVFFFACLMTGTLSCIFWVVKATHLHLVISFCLFHTECYFHLHERAVYKKVYYYIINRWRLGKVGALVDHYVSTFSPSINKLLFLKKMLRMIGVTYFIRLISWVVLVHFRVPLYGLLKIELWGQTHWSERYSSMLF